MSELQKLLVSLKQRGYSSLKVYSEDSKIRFIKVCSPLERKPFLLQVPSTEHYCGCSDHLLEPEEHCYRNYRQREYLNMIKLSDLACFSNHNLCVKNSEIITCFILDTMQSEDTSNISELDDIVIDDYPVQDIYPVFNISQFQELDDPEETILEYYSKIITAEESMNEEQVTRLLDLFDVQKHTLKTMIYEIHKEAFNTRRDIQQCGQNLKRIYTLKERTTDKRDTVRFQIGRLAMETENKIDNLNDTLRCLRNRADSLINKYSEYIDRFNNIA